MSVRLRVATIAGWEGLELELPRFEFGIARRIEPAMLSK